MSTIAVWRRGFPVAGLLGPVRAGAFLPRPVLLGALLLSACPATPERPEIEAGELLVRTADASVLTTEALAALAKRGDFVVQAAECLEKTCRVVVTRADGSAADVAFTWSLVEALQAGVAAAPGAIEGVRPNTVHAQK